MKLEPSFLAFRPLLDAEDLAWFNVHENALSASAKEAEHRSLFADWQEQAAWLVLEEAFEKNPSLEALEIDPDPADVNRYACVRTLRTGQDDFNGLGEDPDGLDEHLQEYLNNMGRGTSRAFLVRLGESVIERGELEEAAIRVLGPGWAAQRRAAALVTTLADASGPTRRPRV